MKQDAAVSHCFVSASKCHGQGLFAATVIPAGTKIPVWGTYFGDAEYRLEAAKDDYEPLRWVQIEYTEPRCWLKIGDKCAAFFANCADKNFHANCKFMEAPVRDERPRHNFLSSNYLCLVTTEIVKSGQELFVPYS